MMRTWREITRVLGELRRLPRVTVTMSGGAEGALLYREFRKRHPRYRIIRNRQWGVELLQLPGSFDDYLRGKEKRELRAKRNRALSLGYSFAVVDPRSRLEEILDVNRSLGERQGRPMHEAYLNRDTVASFFETRPRIYAVLDREGVLRAYVHAPVFGEVCSLARLLGHGDHLDNGVMYFAVSEIVRDMIELKERTGTPMWVEYGTFFGGGEGLRGFKQRLGLRPYRVAWRWVAESSSDGEDPGLGPADVRARS